MHKPLENLDAFENVAANADYAVAIMTNVDHSQIEVVAISDVTEELRAGLAAREMRFAAVCGILDGQPEIQMAYPLPENVAFAVGAAHREYISGVRAKEPEYDWVSRRYHH